MLGWNGENLSTCLKHGSLAGGRDRGVLDIRAHALSAGFQGRLVGDHLHRDLVVLFRGEVEQVQPASGLEHDVRRPDCGERDVVVGESGQLAGLLAIQIVCPDVEPLALVPVRQEVDRAVVPHGLALVLQRVGDVARLERLEIEQGDVRCPATSVPFPGPVVPLLVDIGDHAAVGRHRSELGIGHRELGRQSTGCADAVELVVTLPSALSRRRKQQLAIGGPIHHAVAHGVVGDPNWFSTHAGDHVYIGVAVVVGAECDLGAVGRKARERLLSARRAESVRDAAGLGYDPDVSRVHERDVCRGNIGIAQHPGVDLSLQSGGSEQQHRGRGKEHSVEHKHSPTSRQ